MFQLSDKTIFFRGMILISTLLLFFIDKHLLSRLLNYKLNYIRVYHIIWLLTLLHMIKVTIPIYNKSIACGKIFYKHYSQSDSYNTIELNSYTKKK